MTSNLAILLPYVMDQAREKGFGTKPQDISVAEKIALIHSEITEAGEAFQAGSTDPKDTFPIELGDILQRTLHLGGIYGADFAHRPDYVFSQFPNYEVIEVKLLQLHTLTTHAWESFRHKNVDGFKEQLVLLGYATEQVALTYDFSVADAVQEKIELNRDRVWNPSDLNEKLSD